MAFPDNATVFPVYGQAFDFTDCIKSSVTANPLTGGLGTLAINISKDGAAFGVSVGGSIAEVSGTPGFVNVSLSAADMTAKVIAYNLTSNAANAVYATGEIKTLDLAEFTGKAGDQSVKKLEQYLTDMWGFNFHAMDVVAGATSATMTLYKTDGTTAKVTGTATDDGTTATRGEIS